jgi:molecular chaperone DnaK (HSP70)
VEAAKITLSDSTEAVINAPNCCMVPIDNNPNRRKRVSVHGLTVTREQYESRIEKYVTESLECVQEILRRTQTPANLLDVVLLVGGATMTPCVRAAVDRVFPGKLRPIGELNPMTCVAQGAALWAAEKQKEKSDHGRAAGSKLEVKGRTVRAIGIAVSDGHSSDGFEVIIPRGTLLPMEPIERRFVALQPDRINVPIYEGEEKHASRNRHQGNIRLDLKELGGQPLVPGTPVTVRLKFTENKIIEVIIEPHGRNAITRELDYTEDTACAGERKEELEELEQMIMMADRFLPEYGPFVDEAKRKQIEVSVERANKVLGDETPNRREARLLTKRIYREIIYSDTLGGLLFQAEYLAARPEMEPDLVTRLGSLCAIAKTIYSENLSQPTPAKANDLHQIRKGLEVLVNRAMRTLPRVDPGDKKPESDLGKA